MDTYKEYVIRCKTCNEQIACFAADYEALIDAGSTIEEALNDLGIMNPCSRIAMMNPTIAIFNMENRQVIEGFKSVDAVDDADPQYENINRPIFNKCIGVIQPPAQPTRAPAVAAPLPIPMLVRQNTQTAVPPQRILPNVPGITTITLAQPAMRQVVQPITQPIVQQVIQPLIQPIETVQPIITGIDLGLDIDNLGVGIPVKAPEIDNNVFQEPTTVGIPTINPGPTDQEQRIFVGVDKYCKVLTGRTYLAQ